MAVYQCRLCDLAYHDAMNVIGIFSEEGRSSKIAAKILYASSIMVRSGPSVQLVESPYGVIWRV